MIEIKRLEFNNTETIGVLLIDNKVICYTLELPWKNNNQNVSCIPVGHYKVVKWQSKKTKVNNGFTFKILDLQKREVAGRSGIIIHEGNTHRDTEGCILLGEDIGLLVNTRAVLKSIKAQEKFVKEMNIIDECDLIIQ